MIWWYVVAAVSAYLIAGWNPAITFSRVIYKRDIRTCGSKNPGFTNFKRTFGHRWAWWVLVLDLGKAAVAVAVFAALYAKAGGAYSVGAAYTGLFAMLGHAFPVWYRFRGGKGFLVCLSVLWLVDWRAGVWATALMILLLLTTHYMSLATVVAMLSAIAVTAAHKLPVATVLMYAACAVFMTVRHHENFRRLKGGTESKFYLKSSEKGHAES